MWDSNVSQLGSGRWNFFVKLRGCYTLIRNAWMTWFQICIWFGRFYCEKLRFWSLNVAKYTVIANIYFSNLKPDCYTSFEPALRADSKYVYTSDDLFKVTRGHQRSLKGQNRRIMVEPSQLVGIYSRYICFDSKFCVEFKFKIIWGQFRSSKVIKGQISVKTVEIGSNWAD